MQKSEQNDQEDHLEEGDEEVARCEREPDDAEDRRYGALNDGQAEGVQRSPDPLARPVALLGEVVVGDVSGKIDREPDAHDQVDQRDAVESNSPPRHVPEMI